MRNAVVSHKFLESLHKGRVDTEGVFGLYQRLMQYSQRLARFKPYQFLTLAILLVLVSCTSSKTAEKIEPPTTYSQIQHGIASWYGKPFHGRRMANGQRFDMNKMTAAHRHLPFGTRVEVTNLQNAQTVVVVITDRGPFIKNRILDVSRKAAQDLGFIGAGTARIEMKVLN